VVGTHLQERVAPGTGSPKRRCLDHASVSDCQDLADEQDDVDSTDEQGGADTADDADAAADKQGSVDLADEQDSFGGADEPDEIDGMDPDSVGPTDDDHCLDNEDTRGPAIGLWPYTCLKVCH